LDLREHLCGRPHFFGQFGFQKSNGRVDLTAYFVDPAKPSCGLTHWITMTAERGSDGFDWEVVTTKCPFGDIYESFPFYVTEHDKRLYLEKCQEQLILDAKSDLIVRMTAMLKTVGLHDGPFKNLGDFRGTVVIDRETLYGTGHRLVKIHPVELVAMEARAQTDPRLVLVKEVYHDGNRFLRDSLYSAVFHFNDSAKVLTVKCANDSRLDNGLTDCVDWFWLDI
jgi:hypothetical protein